MTTKKDSVNKQTFSFALRFWNQICILFCVKPVSSASRSFVLFEGKGSSANADSKIDT